MTQNSEHYLIVVVKGFAEALHRIDPGFQIADQVEVKGQILVADGVGILVKRILAIDTIPFQ